MEYCHLLVLFLHGVHQRLFQDLPKWLLQQVQIMLEVKELVVFSCSTLFYDVYVLRDKVQSFSSPQCHLQQEVDVISFVVMVFEVARVSASDLTQIAFWGFSSTQFLTN